METNTLNKLGLNDNEIIVYEELLQSGQQKASQISKKTPLKRGLIYKTLEDLEQKGLIIREDDKNAVSIFSPIHPNALKEIAENKAREALEAKESLQKELGSFISMYNLANNKPGVEFYEGIEGMEKVYNAILNETPKNGTIISFVKVLNQESNPKTTKVLQSYIKSRRKKAITAKVIAVDDEFGKKLKTKDSENTRKTKLLNQEKFPLNFPGGEIIITNNSLYLTSYNNDTYTATIISDKNMSQLLTLIFYNLWKQL